jgi:hypothetical protein
MLLICASVVDSGHHKLRSFYTYMITDMWQRASAKFSSNCTSWRQRPCTLYTLLTKKGALKYSYMCKVASVPYVTRSDNIHVEVTIVTKCLKVPRLLQQEGGAESTFWWVARHPSQVFLGGYGQPGHTCEGKNISKVKQSHYMTWRCLGGEEV